MKHTIKAEHVDRFLAAHSEIMIREGLEVKGKSEPDDNGFVAIMIDYTEAVAELRAGIRLRQEAAMNKVLEQMNTKMQEIRSMVSWHGLILDNSLCVYQVIAVLDAADISVNITKVHTAVEAHVKSTLLEAGLVGFSKTNDDGVSYYGRFTPDDCL